MQELKENKSVILVSPPYMDLSFPEYGIPMALTKGCNYMNPGLLIASSVLDEYNISNVIVKVDKCNDISSIYRYLGDATKLIGISCTCAWEYLESLKIAEMVKKINKDVKIFMAGWQVKSIGLRVFDDSKNIDYIIMGDAEYTISKLYYKVISQYNVSEIPSLYERGQVINNEKNSYPKVDFRVIDFSKFPNYKKYIPFVEESRNCPYNCTFCLNSCVCDIYQNVPLDIFIKNIESMERIYGDNIQANLLAANFGVNVSNTKDKLNYLKTKKIKWNIEFHVDNKWEDYIDMLKDAGINKVSIGMESASLKTLKLMNKTKDSVGYLKRLECLMVELNKLGIKPSLNMLFDYRDDEDTIKETLEYLEKHKSLFKKIKGNFMFGFEGLMDSIDYSYQPNIIINEYSKSIHAYPILPNQFDLARISYVINQIEAGNYDKKILKMKKK